MVDADVYPDGDNAVAWQINPATGTHWEKVNEDKGSPGGGLIYCDINHDNLTDDFHMDDSIQDCDEYTQVMVGLYKNVVDSDAAGTPAPTVNIYVNGAWQVAKTIAVGGPVWQTFTWSGLSGNQASLDALRVKVFSGVLNAGKYMDDSVSIVCIYATITYTATAPTGYGHDFMGVPAANIDEVNGVPSANIDTIKGV